MCTKGTHKKDKYNHISQGTTSTGGSLVMQYHITSIQIEGLKTPKNLKNIFPRIKGSRGGLI